MGSLQGSPYRPAVLRPRSARGPAARRTGPPLRPQPSRSPRCHEHSSLAPRLPSVTTSAFDDAAEADMAGRGIDRLGVARCGAIAPAIVGRAKVRAALQHLAWNAHGGLARIVARLDGRAARVLR